MSRGLRVARQVELPIWYKGHLLANPLKIDMIVEEIVIVECKATLQPHDIFEVQLLTYLRLSELRVGLVINFGQKLVKDGIRRIINGKGEQSQPPKIP